MSETGKLYRVLRAGVRQRKGASWSRPEVGDLINVSDRGAGLLVGLGYIEPADRKPAPTLAVAIQPGPDEPVATPQLADELGSPGGPERCQKHPRYRGRGEPHHGCQDCARIHGESHAHEVHP